METILPVASNWPVCNRRIYPSDLRFIEQDGDHYFDFFCGACQRTIYVSARPAEVRAWQDERMRVNPPKMMAVMREELP